MEFIHRFFTPPVTSYFLFGPRGTGKSVFTQTYYPEALRIGLLEPDVYREYAARPERLRDRLAAEPQTGRVVIDEVQRVPELLSVVHALIESRRKIQFILTGSSARKLKRTGVDMMAGRAVLRTLHPLMAAELGERFSLGSALGQGLVPLIIAARQPADVLRSYASLYLREEVQMEGLVRNIGAFSRFLEAVSFSHGQPVNLSNVSRECQVERKTVEGYLEILEDLLLAFRLPVFTRRARRELSVHPKLFLFDAGVFRSLRPSGPLDRSEEIEGAALEGLVAQHLRAWTAYRLGGETLHFWRTRSGVEVDFVVYGPHTLAAIEVKNTARARSEDVRGLRAFAEDYPQSQCVLLYRGKERLKLHGVLCLPCEEFLLGLHPAKPLPI
ncbi:MAG TPA: AAA family ATPase [Candidatus Paceibacterota bacterium]|nr:AAA family ATPase [Verrucomicrobiota bacterium]HRY50694.1 AAA family ATPase [Candidatus Paceibacterota bacterium]HSA03530.1 AAA family ATPase [Candidatus Paceibacterota bacterium]